MYTLPYQFYWKRLCYEMVLLNHIMLICFQVLNKFHVSNKGAFTDMKEFEHGPVRKEEGTNNDFNLKYRCLFE